MINRTMLISFTLITDGRKKNVNIEKLQIFIPF